MLADLGMDHHLDETQFAPVAENFRWAAGDAGFEVGRMAEYDPRVYEHQLPGGMTGTLINQLAQHGMTDRLPAVLAEIPQVRLDLGEPIMATPFSQFVGVQAVLNVVTGERYQLVPDEVVQYVLGHYGAPVGRIDPNVYDRIMSSPRATAFAGWTRAQPTLQEIRGRFARGLSDEELLLRFLASDEEVDAMLAAGPVPTDPRRASRAIVAHIESLLAETTSLTSLSVSTPEASVTLRRRSRF